MYIIGAGKTFILHYPEPHLWFILTNPKDSDNIVVAVMVRSVTRFTDSTVVLKDGDHPFIRHNSSVHYSTAKFFKKSSIIAKMKKGKCHLKEDMSCKLLKRVRKGLLDSPFTVNAIRDYCKKVF